MPFPFRLFRGKAAGALGAGADGYGLKQPQSLPLHDGFMVPGYMVTRSFAPIEGGFNKDSAQGPNVDILGNGLSIHQQMELQRLATLSNSPGN